MVSLDAVAVVALLVTTGGTAAYLSAARRRREARDAEILEEALARQAQPATLHPRIDASKCMGCMSCATACPEGDIIGMVRGQAKLLDPSACIGHARCVLECPVGAVRLVMGSSARGIDLPEVSESFESSRPGVHVVGELGGMGLIRNAINQGLSLADQLGDLLRPGGEAGVVDVAIVGAGPAGLATAIGLRAQGLSFRVLEQEPTFGGAITHYPRQKLVMTEPTELPGYGTFGRRVIPKEELLEMLQQAVDRTDLDVECGTRVTGLEGNDGAFVIGTSKGPVRARKVVLATGRRGTPRKLGVPGEALSKVSYSLIDPAQYDGRDVLVVGGGDSALEAAIALAERSSARVALAYHGKQLQRGRAANRERFAALASRGHLRALMDTKVTEIRKREVVLQQGGKRTRLANDFVLVCAGGELPVEFLQKAGVELRRYWGTELGATGEVSVAGAAPAPLRAAARRSRTVFYALLALAGLVLVALAAKGQGYYGLDRLARRDHPLHGALKASGPWGHGVGVAAAALMLSAFGYSLRKRVRALKGVRPIRAWLTWHQFAGLLGAGMVFFHAGFRSSSAITTLTSAALAAVVITGVFGRYVRGFAPRPGTELGALLQRWERLAARVRELTADATDALAVQSFLARASAPPQPAGLVALLFRLPGEQLQHARALARLRGLFAGEGSFETFSEASRRLQLLRHQARFHEALRQLVSGWRAVHLVSTVVFLLLLATHVAVSLFRGHAWLW